MRAAARGAQRPLLVLAALVAMRAPLGGRPLRAVSCWEGSGAGHSAIAPVAAPPAAVKRRAALAVAAGLWGPAAAASRGAAEVPAAPPNGGCVGCLGVIDGLLARCTGDLQGCVSSQDDRPQVFEAPWVLPELQVAGRPKDVPAAGDVAGPMKLLQRAVLEAGGRVVSTGEGGRYLRTEFPVEVPFLGKDVDDCEWYFTPDDNAVQFRAERRTGRPDFGENRRRLEQVRQILGWDVLPVLRNRQRALFFAESPLDSFGPALYDALRPGEELTPYEAGVLARQGERLKAGRSRGQLAGFPLASDDLGRENEDGILDAATRDFLRTTCDPKTQICE